MMCAHHVAGPRVGVSDERADKSSSRSSYAGMIHVEETTLIG
jgi:hypothetical protein